MPRGFTIKPVTVTQHGFNYTTYLLRGRLNGQRVRLQFKSREEAVGRKNELEVEAANAGGEIQARNTRLSADQLTEAEAAFRRLGGKSLSSAVDWFLTTYRPPVTETLLDDAQAPFLADRAKHVRARQLRDYKHIVEALRAAFPKRAVHSIKTLDIQSYLATRNVGKKRWNNLRGDLHAFFAFCQAAPRQWTNENPVTAIQSFRISRGVPEIITAATAANLMAFLEGYSGGKRANQPAGYLVPYFALCLFAGLRPSVRDGEIRKVAEAPEKFIKTDLGVIQITPEASKVRSVRQVKIRPNLAEWLLRYPVKKYPIIPKGMDGASAFIRKKFELGDDVLRHTFISAHVAKWKSMGEAALEAGNSEAMIRKHYLNLITETEAATFWQIAPGVRPSAEVVPISAA